MKRLLLAACVAAVSVGSTGCGDSEGNGDGNGDPALADCTTVLSPGGDDQAAVQTALIEAQSGDVVCFGSGTFGFTDELTLTTPGVTLRGAAGHVLDFAGQVRGGNGLMVTGDGTRLEDLVVRNTAGDGIRAEGVDGVTFRNVDVEWEGPPSEDSGAYGLYPVLSTNVLIENSRVRGASDAGLYVGQSSVIEVRDSEAVENVAGIEIENSTAADVHGNHAHGNAGGLLIFALPNLEMEDSDTTRAFDNLVEGNNTANFAPAGNIVATVPSGTGVILLATDRNEIFGNTIRDNDSAGLTLVGFQVTGRSWDDPAYDPYPEGNYVHDNVFENNAGDPAVVARALTSVPAPEPLADLLWDGLVDASKGDDPALANCFENNGEATFLDFAYGGGERSTDIGPHTCAHDPLPDVVVDAP